MIDRDLYDSYESALSTLDELTQESVKYLVSLTKNYPHDELEEALRKSLPEVVAFYGSAAAQAAADFYRQERETSDVDSEYTPTAAGDIPIEWIYQDINEAIEPRRNGELNWENLSKNLAAKSAKRIRSQADYTITSNCERDPCNPKWAIVPHVGACGWCIMIASWGFHYRSEQTASSQRHVHCRCMVVKDSDADNPALDGYYPEKCAEAYQKCLSAVEDDVNRQWAALSDEERGKYENKSHFKRNMVIAEMNRRDREWLRTGELPEVKYEKPRNHLTKNEKKTVDALQKNGFNVVVRTEDASAKANIDLELGSSGQLWEMKNVGNGKHAVEDSMGDSYHKWTRLGLDPSEARTVISSYGASRSEDKIVEDIQQRLYYSKEVIFVTRDDRIKRFIKE